MVFPYGYQDPNYIPGTNVPKAAAWEIVQQQRRAEALRQQAAPPRQPAPATKAPYRAPTKRLLDEAPVRPPPRSDTLAWEPTKATKHADKPSPTEFGGPAIVLACVSLVSLVASFSVAGWLMFGADGVRDPDGFEQGGLALLGLVVAYVTLWLNLGTEEDESYIAGGVFVSILVWVAAVPLLRVGYVLAWAVVLVAAAILIVCTACAGDPRALGTPPRIGGIIVIVGLAFLFVGTVAAEVGVTDGIWATPARVVGLSLS